MDGIHIRFTCWLYKLPGVGIQRFQISALAFSKYKIKRQCALATTADAGDDRELIPWQADVNILQVVFAGMVNLDRLY